MITIYDKGYLINITTVRVTATRYWHT